MTPQEMKDLQAAKDTVLTFGKHRDRRMGEVPSAYLYYMAVEFDEPWASKADKIWRWRDKHLCHRGIPKYNCHAGV